MGRRSRNSERVRAHLYEREFPAKPVRRGDGAREHGRARELNHAAHPTVSRTRRGFRRTNVTCIWGVSDPPQLDYGAKKGGWQ